MIVSFLDLMAVMLFRQVFFAYLYLKLLALYAFDFVFFLIFHIDIFIALLFFIEFKNSSDRSSR